MCAGICFCVLRHLTHIKLKSLILEGVCAASSLIMLLQNYNSLASFGQKCRCCQTSHAAADHHSIQSRGNTVHTKSCRLQFKVRLVEGCEAGLKKQFQIMTQWAPVHRHVEGASYAAARLPPETQCSQSFSRLTITLKCCFWLKTVSEQYSVHILYIHSIIRHKILLQFVRGNLWFCCQTYLNCFIHLKVGLL